MLLDEGSGRVPPGRPEGEIGMKRWIVVAAGVMTMSGLTLFAQDAQKVAQGRKLYEELKCGTCHIVEGKGGKMASALDGVGSKLTAADLKMWLTDPAAMHAKAATKPKVMMKKTERPDADLDALVAYLQSLKKK
jgi:mono/diheme cytochrome c family protein